MEFPFNSADSQGMFLLLFILYLGVYFEPQEMPLTHA
jgi:hypothetical protein